MKFSRIWQVLLIVLGVLLSLFPRELTAASRPNIVLIFSDDQGMNDLSCYGSEIPTPHIDSIAKNGARFDAFYVASPICTPSRFGLLTGRFPNRSKDQLMSALMYTLERDDARGIRSGETTIAQVLQTSGYRTAIVGKWHLGHGLPEFSPNLHGFDYSYGTTGGCVDYFSLKYGYKPDWHRNWTQIEEEGYSTDLLSDDAVRYIDRQKKGNPFFLYLAYTAPHYGKGWDEEKQALTNILQAKKERLEQLKHISDPNRREFAGMVLAMDEGVGRVLEALRRKKLDRDTLVIFTCDNGGDPRYGGSNKPFRGRKAQLFEGGIRVPCLAQWTGKIKAGSVIQEPVTALDLFPTFCELAGVKTARFALDGDSIAALLLKGKPLPERDLFWQLPTADALRRGSWKYVRVLKDEMLFNMDSDPSETQNLAAEKPELLQRLKAAQASIAAGLHQ